MGPEPDGAAPRRVARLVGLDSLTPAQDVALGLALLDELGARRGHDLVRVYRPSATAAFSRRDTLQPGFADAVQAVREVGFTPVVRGPGGRLALYHHGSLVIDRVCSDLDPRQGIEDRFRGFGDLYVRVLRGFGLDARIGEVPGEYCPGRFSVNAAGTHKIVGTAQRLSRHGWLFSTSIVVRDADPIREGLRVAYDALDYDWDPATVGAVEQWSPGIGVRDVADALLDGMRTLGPVVPTELSADVLARVDQQAEQHLVPFDGSVRPRVTDGRLATAWSTSAPRRTRELAS
ncbi:MAG: lipoate--protein ligase [Nocardioidaceae bacterium]|nr:lipoate--protein ligase [Nocardioidaceae bacterium]